MFFEKNFITLPVTHFILLFIFHISKVFYFFIYAIIFKIDLKNNVH